MANLHQWSGPVAVIAVSAAADFFPALKPLAHVVAAVVFTWGVAGVLAERAQRKQSRQTSAGTSL